MRGGKFAVAVASLVVLGATSGCKGCRSGGDEPTSQIAEESEVPAPKDLVAEIVLASPGTTWTKLQRGLGGTVGLLPPSFASAAVLAMGLDPVLAGEIDATTPGFGALAGDPLDPAWAFAVRASDPRHVRAVLAGGDTARYDAREVAGLTELVPKVPSKDPGRPSPPVIGLTKGGFVVVAGSSAALASIGPYVTRTLSKRALPAASAGVVDISREAIRTVVAPRASAAWSSQKEQLLARDEEARRAHGGRPPDFGDPKAIVGALDAVLGERVALLADMEHARLAVDVLDEDVRIAMTFTPTASGGPAARWVAAMTAADLKSALAMPKSSVLAGAVATPRSGEADGGADAIGAAMLEALGGRLAAGDDARLREAIADWGKARGDRVTFAASWAEPRGALVRMAVVDREAAARAMRATVVSAGVPPLSELLHLKSVRVSDEDVAPLGKVTLATFVRTEERAVRRRARPGDAGAPEAKIGGEGVAWLLEGDTLVAAGGREPLVTLRTMSRPDATLGDEPAVKRVLALVTEAGDTTETVVVGQPFELDERRAPLPSAPVAITLGRKEGAAVLRAAMPYALVRDVGRLRLSP